MHGLRQPAERQRRVVRAVLRARRGRPHARQAPRASCGDGPGCRPHPHPLAGDDDYLRPRGEAPGHRTRAARRVVGPGHRAGGGSRGACPVRAKPGNFAGHDRDGRRSAANRQSTAVVTKVSAAVGSGMHSVSLASAFMSWAVHLLLAGAFLYFLWKPGYRIGGPHIGGPKAS